MSASSGFDRSAETNGGVDVEGHPKLSEFLRDHQPYFDRLYERRLRV